MRLRIVEPAALWRALPAALAGSAVLAPVRAGDARALAMLRPDVPVAEPDAALVLATSGSTGVPKGVVLSRAALAAGASATHERLGGPGTWACALPVHYVAGVMTLVRSFHAGRTPVFVRPDLADLAVPDGRAYLSLVPTQLHRLLAADADPRLAERVAAFDAVLVGGAALDADLAARAGAAGIRVVRTYGASETAGGCVYDGVPLPGVEVTVGAGGRILVGGATVFSGYRLRPELTTSALVGGRFVTSDRGAWVDGRLEVRGRLDDVVITGGVNVDLAAAQRAADAAFGTPAAGGIVVLGVPDARWGTRVVAVTTGTLDTDGVRDRLAGRVEAAALPREVRRVAALPLTPSGKIDRRALSGEWR